MKTLLVVASALLLGACSVYVPPVSGSVQPVVVSRPYTGVVYNDGFYSPRYHVRYRRWN
jgi:hypothetical protein